MQAVNKNIWVVKDERDGGLAIYDHEGNEITAIWGKTALVADYSKAFDTRLTLNVEILLPNMAGSIEEMMRAIRGQKSTPREVTITEDGKPEYGL
jgi:hypothetical protein